MSAGRSRRRATRSARMVLPIVLVAAVSIANLVVGVKVSR